jgi:signal peptidase I
MMSQSARESVAPAPGLMTEVIVPARVLLYRLAISGMLVLGALELGATAAAISVSRAGYQALAVQASSMQPAINPGDLLLLQPVSPDNIHLGDIITFPAPAGDGGYVTDRVIRVVATPAGPTFTTRGDRAVSADPWSIVFNSGSGLRVAYVLPGLGKVFTFAHSQGIALPIGALVLAVLLRLVWVFGGKLLVFRDRGRSAPSPQHPTPNTLPPAAR